LNFAHATFIGDFVHSNDQPLAAGGSYTQSATFTLPKGIGGTAANPQTFYVYVITDSHGDLTAHTRDNSNSRNIFSIRGYEDPSNNQGGGTFPVIYREPDLQVTSLAVPSSTPHAGDTIPITWTVTNAGNRDTREGHWTDRVYLSTDPSLDHGDIELGEITHNSILATGASYTQTLNVPLPYGIGGNFYILVFTDSDVTGTIDVAGVSGGGTMGAVPEFQGEGNNITYAPMPVDPNPPPDLQVTAVAAVGPDPSQPGHVLTGQSFSVTITVQSSTRQPVSFDPGVTGVLAGNAPPVFLTYPVTLATAGQPYSYQASAIDPDGDQLSYLLLHSPAGMTVDSDGLVHRFRETDHMWRIHISRRGL
jgi:hypothetical protein